MPPLKITGSLNDCVLHPHPHSSLLLDSNKHEALALVNPQLGLPESPALPATTLLLICLQMLLCFETSLPY